MDGWTNEWLVGWMDGCMRAYMGMVRAVQVASTSMIIWTQVCELSRSTVQ